MNITTVAVNTSSFTPVRERLELWMDAAEAFGIGWEASVLCTNPVMQAAGVIGCVFTEGEWFEITTCIGAEGMCLTQAMKALQ